MNDSFKDNVSGEDAKVFTKRSVVEAEGKELRNLGADMLSDVFLCLPQKELVEVLSVSKAWGKAVMEGSGLWGRVIVWEKWNLGGEKHNTRENEVIRRVFGLAKDVTFSKAFRGDEKRVMSVGG